MESDLVSALVTIGVGVLVYVAERISSRKKNAATHRSAPTPAGGTTERVRASRQFSRAEERPRVSRRAEDGPGVARRAGESTPAAPTVRDMPEEGVRVTSDEPMQDNLAAENTSRVPDIPGGDLRAAIIWSEILKTKF